VPELRRPDGCALAYEVHGRDDAPPIILLEGLGGDIAGWRRNIPHLATELRVVAYDLRGNGDSDAPDAPMTMTIFVDDTLAVLDALGIERAHVYGQSLGGMIAQELALTHPERVRALVLAATHAGLAHVVPVDARAPTDRPHLALYSRRFAEEHPEHVAEDLRVGSRTPQRPHAGRRQWDAMQGFDAYDRLPRLRTPTLVLHGTEDRLVSPGNARVLAERIPGAELVMLEGAGHVYHSEQADAADAVVLGFLGRHLDA
jgi:pimeloyl-ACP methyl ester carboxylesterase